MIDTCLVTDPPRRDLSCCKSIFVRREIAMMRLHQDTANEKPKRRLGNDVAIAHPSIEAGK
jgi:hypothetical protein